jgi:glucokinase
MTETIGIDVGATKTAAVRMSPDGRIHARVRRDTPHGAPRELLGLLAAMVGELRTANVTAVGVGLPGSVDAVAGVLALAPALELRDVAVRELLRAAVGMPVAVDNDANAAAWAEHRLGAGRDHGDLLLLALGTGVGCGVVAGGRIFRGAHGFAVEVWHLQVEPGNAGRLGDLASGTGLTRLGRAAAARHPDSRLARLAGGASERVRGELVTQAAQEGDEAARAVLRRVGERLGLGIASVVTQFDPSIVVIAGGPAQAGELLLAPARESYRRALPLGPYFDEPPIVAALLGDDAAPIGAGLLAAKYFD